MSDKHKAFYENLLLLRDEPENFRAMLKEQPELLNMRGPLDETLLHYAAVEYEVDIVKVLIELGADLNAKNEFGGTALSDAASLGSLDLVQILVKHGADVHSVNNSGDTALHKIAETLSRHQRVYEFLVKSGARVDCHNESGETPEALLNEGYE